VDAECPEVRRQGADQHVGLTLNLADLCLPDTQTGGKFDLCNAGGSANFGEFDHVMILLVRNTSFKEYSSAAKPVYPEIYGRPTDGCIVTGHLIPVGPGYRLVAAKWMEPNRGRRRMIQQSVRRPLP
jgi:hypothetical protein